MKLLIADRDADLVEMLTGWLRSRGFQVKFAASPERFRRTWLEQRPDLVIVEATLGHSLASGEGGGGLDGLDLCRELRCSHDALVLAVGCASDAATQIRCLEAGADAYLPKPFLPAQLLAHLHALSRRVRHSLLRHPSALLQVGPLRLDALRNEVRRGPRVVRLTPTESKLLHLLAVNASDVCTLEQIVAHVWGYSEESDTKLVKAHIRHLREKIEPDPSHPRYLVTVPGSGYMLTRQPSEEDGATQSADTQPPTDEGMDTATVAEMDSDIDMDVAAASDMVPPLSTRDSASDGAMTDEPAGHRTFHDILPPPPQPQAPFTAREMSAGFAWWPPQQDLGTTSQPGLYPAD